MYALGDLDKKKAKHGCFRRKIFVNNCFSQSHYVRKMILKRNNEITGRTIASVLFFYFNFFASALALAASSLAFFSASLLAAASSLCFLMIASLARSARASSVFPAA